MIVKLGYDPVWRGTINLTPDIQMRTIYRGVVPFIGGDLLLLAILAAFPAISLWLPKALAS